jgi:hypothetical protein
MGLFAEAVTVIGTGEAAQTADGKKDSAKIKVIVETKVAVIANGSFLNIDFMIAPPCFLI